MNVVRVRNKMDIRRFLERDPYLHIYGLGDLDDFFWPRTTWFGTYEDGQAAGANGKLRALVLVYEGPGIPTVLALCGDSKPAAGLLFTIAPSLPPRFHAHLSPGIESGLLPTHQAEFSAPHLKMALTRTDAVDAVRPRDIVSLTVSHQEALQRLFDEAYPGNWFDARMLETGQYFGTTREGRIVSAAGVHVYSPEYRVAAIGNVVTHPEHRNHGLASQVTAAVCRSLLRQNVRIGLNVQADNVPAIACYRKLGFEHAADYGEFVFSRRRQGTRQAR